MLVGRHYNAIVNPFSLAPGFYNSRAAQISQMAGNFRLRLAKDFHEETHAHLILFHQIQEPEPRSVGERNEETLHVNFDRLFHTATILARDYIFVLTDMFPCCNLITFAKTNISEDGEL